MKIAFFHILLRVEWIEVDRVWQRRRTIIGASHIFGVLGNLMHFETTKIQSKIVNF